MRIITISRQFGSGGRELGKRLSDVLGWDYYDREIISAVSQESGMNADYVRRALSSHGWHNYQLTYRNSFHQALGHSAHQTEMLLQQRKVIEEIAAAGNDCIIVGRDADVILYENSPFRIFVCADLRFRLERCLKHEEKLPAENRMTEKEILRSIRRIDKNRRHTREILTGKSHGDASSFDLTVNTTHWEIRKLTEAVADFSRCWFENHGK